MSERRTDAFRWVVDTLQADPTLRRKVDLWLVWDGVTRANVDFPANKVCARLTPILEPEAIETTASYGQVIYSTPVAIQIELQTPPVLGEQTPDDLVALWGDMQAALPPANKVLRQSAGEAGISWWEWVQPGAAAGGAHTRFFGTLRLAIYQRR